ncbi:hypothetical protein BVRB_6g155620 isoform A [Beta vulgaris subsp. vulgaris]|uniref:Uncharacterized protein n=1 Tax=Beta vulgaris subsp. vulgaris TaxID=3555 RepID=A0A0J8BBK1_BETVV|nr:hypothetical protein BVRB_6g155620 isoform A [Beta vulgaris subsp. vulgaris]
MLISTIDGVKQISDAVVVARSLGTTPLIPDIRGSKLGDKRSIEFQWQHLHCDMMISTDGCIMVWSRSS